MRNLFFLFLTLMACSNQATRLVIPGNENISTGATAEQAVPSSTQQANKIASYDAYSDSKINAATQGLYQVPAQAANSSSSNMALRSQDNTVDLTTAAKNDTSAVYTFNSGSMSLSPANNDKAKAVNVTPGEKKDVIKKIGMQSFYLQIGSFKSQQNANKVSSEVKSSLNIDNVVLKETGEVFKVWIGPYDSKNSAKIQDAIQKLSNSKFDSFFVVSE